MLRKPLPVICLGVILGIVTAPAYAQIYNELISFNGNTAAGQYDSSNARGRWRSLRDDRIRWNRRLHG